jgi:tight adherence protein C
MSRAVIAAGILLWAGATLLLSGIGRLSRPSLAERLRPYHPGDSSGRGQSIFDATSLRQLAGPLARNLGSRLASLFGVSEDAAIRLRRIHSPVGVTAYRIRQLAWTVLTLLAAVLLSIVIALPAAVAALALLGAPLLTFLTVEQRLATASEAWQRNVLHELPVVSEQLAMLLAAGYSLGAAINRLAQRGAGCCARDLTEVTNRIRQGLTEEAALQEWSEKAGVPAVDRLVSVLALNSEASDLARLVSLEARQVRQDVHRLTLSLIERRSEQVWIPVTVATLVPGVILIAVPFLAALHTFSNA